MDEQSRLIAKWLRDRGWKQHFDSWWYMPLPGWRGKICIVGQRLYSLSEAYDEERRKTAIVG